MNEPIVKNFIQGTLKGRNQLQFSGNFIRYQPKTPPERKYIFEKNTKMPKAGFEPPISWLVE